MVESITLKNTVTETSILMNMLTTDYILVNVDFGTVKGEHHSYKYINQIGSSVTNTTLGTRDINIVGYIIGSDKVEIQRRKSLLNSIINPQQAMEVHTNGYKIQMLPTSSVKYSTSDNENNEVLCKFQIEGLCPSPLFEDATEKSIAAVGTIPMFRFPLIIPAFESTLVNNGIIMGVRQQSLITLVTNEGTVNTGLKIMFLAKGVVENPKIINIKTQEYFRINKTMQAGERVVISTETGGKRVLGYLNNQEYNYSGYKDLDSTWLQLNTGETIFGYSADLNLDLLEVWLYFSNKYLEVQ